MSPPSLTPAIDACRRAIKETKRTINESDASDGQKRVMIALLKASSRAVATELDLHPNGSINDCLNDFETGFASAMSSVVATLIGGTELDTEGKLGVMQTFLNRTSKIAHAAFYHSVKASSGNVAVLVESIHHHKTGNA